MQFWTPIIKTVSPIFQHFLKVRSVNEPKKVDSVPRQWEHWISIFTVLAISRICLEPVFRLFCASSFIVTVHPLSLWYKTSPPPQQGARAETQAAAHHPQHRRPLRGWPPTRTGHWKRNSFSFLFKIYFSLFKIFQSRIITSNLIFLFYFLVRHLISTLNWTKGISLRQTGLRRKYCNPTQGSCIDPIHEALRRSPIQVLTQQMLLNFNTDHLSILPLSYWYSSKVSGWTLTVTRILRCLLVQARMKQHIEYLRLTVLGFEYL